MPTTWDGEAIFPGAGNLDSPPATITVVASLTVSGIGSLVALGIKPANRISARLVANGGMTIITIAPRLTASAAFVGNGQFAFRAHETVDVLSTAQSVRYSFPTVAIPGDPFVRRPSRTYKNYSISARFVGAGRMTSIAS